MDMLEPVTFTPIGVIHTPHTQPEGTPIQPSGAEKVRGWVEVLPEYLEGLADLDGFSHLILLYHFHRAGAPRLTVTPFLDDQSHGVFATRAPVRPNPLGLSVVRLVGIDGGTLDVAGVDMLDGTPLLDIKPYVPVFDEPGAVRTGWLGETAGRAGKHRADDRFA